MFAPSMLMACGGLVRDALVLGALVQGREGQRAAENLAAQKLAAQAHPHAIPHAVRDGHRQARF
jgi:hypothetical protein